MAASYVINFTDPSKLPFTVNPGEVDGPGEVQAHTSIKMHGQGSTSYGENVNENFIKLLENFANPTPPPFPIEGQIWYDSDEPLMKYYDGTDWIGIGKPSSGCPNGGTGPNIPSPPNNLQFSGQLWYDECGVYPPTLRVYDGAADAWQSCGFRYLLREGDNATDHDNFMTGNLNLNNNRLLNVSDPIVPTDGMSEGYADLRYVNVTGDAMTGLLVLSGDPVVPLGAATRQYVDNGLATKIDLDGSNTPMTGYLTLNANPISPMHATTMQYVEGLIAGVELTKIDLDGSNTPMTGALLLSTTGDPNLANAAVSRQFVNDNYTRVNPAALTEKDGDVLVSGTTIFIYAAGAYRQIYPAVYSA